MIWGLNSRQDVSRQNNEWEGRGGGGGDKEGRERGEKMTDCLKLCAVSKRKERESYGDFFFFLRKEEEGEDEPSVASVSISNSSSLFFALL